MKLPAFLDRMEPKARQRTVGILIGLPIAIVAGLLAWLPVWLGR